MKIECGITLIALHSIVFRRVRGIFTRPLDVLLQTWRSLLRARRAKNLRAALIGIEKSLSVGVSGVISLDCTLHGLARGSFLKKL